MKKREKLTLYIECLLPRYISLFVFILLLLLLSDNAFSVFNACVAMKNKRDRSTHSIKTNEKEENGIIRLARNDTVRERDYSFFL